MWLDQDACFPMQHAVETLLGDRVIAEADQSPGSARCAQLGHQRFKYCRFLNTVGEIVDDEKPWPAGNGARDGGKPRTD